MSNHALGNMLYQLGWPDRKVTAALTLHSTGTPSQKTKLFSEIAPQFRAAWHSV